MMTPKAFGVVDVDPPAVRFFFTTLIVVLLSTNRSLLLLSNSFGLQHAARALTLVSKIIQNIANGIEFKKEAFMIPFNDFVNDNQKTMNAFLDEAIRVSPAAVQAVAPLATRNDAYNRDLPALHWFIVKNLPAFVKSVCDYKQFDVLRDLCTALVDAGEPPSRKPSSLE